jgi:hypothetical protein
MDTLDIESNSKIRTKDLVRIRQSYLVSRISVVIKDSFTIYYHLYSEPSTKLCQEFRFAEETIRVIDGTP